MDSLPEAALGMAVTDSTGADLGTVTAVQPPGTGVRPDLPAGEAEHLMATGYLRVDGGGLVTNDFYAGPGQIAAVAAPGEPGVITLSVSSADLRRAG